MKCLFIYIIFSFPEYVALYTYESPEPGDLTFREGDVILVSKREGEWWHGSIGNCTGLFPNNYVKPKETDVRALNTYCHTGETTLSSPLLYNIVLVFRMVFLQSL